MVDGLHLPHFDEPDADVLSSCLQNPLAVILRLIQNLLGEKGADRDPSNTSLRFQDMKAKRHSFLRRAGGDLGFFFLWLEFSLFFFFFFARL